MILSNATVPLVGLVDTAIMGHLPDPAFIGGVALGGLIFSYVYWGFGFLRMAPPAWRRKPAVAATWTSCARSWPAPC